MAVFRSPRDDLDERSATLGIEQDKALSMQPLYRSSKKTKGLLRSITRRRKCNDLNKVSLDSDGTSSASDDLTLVDTRTKEPLVESVANCGRS